MTGGEEETRPRRGKTPAFATNPGVGRPSCSPSQSLARISSSRSRPVFTRSVRARRRDPPSRCCPLLGEQTDTHQCRRGLNPRPAPGLVRRQRRRVPRVARVVDVNAKWHVPDGLVDRPDASRNVTGNRDADGVGDAISPTPVAASRPAMSATRPTGTSPSYGQPNDADIVTDVLTPAAFASGTTSSTVAIAASVGIPWFFSENVSVTITTRLISSTWSAGPARSRVH